MDYIQDAIYRIMQFQKEKTERTLAEIIEKYDFIVGSTECKHELMKVLPEAATVVCSPYIESPTTIYVVKKFDALDLLKAEELAEKEYVNAWLETDLKNWFTEGSEPYIHVDIANASESEVNE